MAKNKIAADLLTPLRVAVKFKLPGVASKVTGYITVPISAAEIQIGPKEYELNADILRDQVLCLASNVVSVEPGRGEIQRVMRAIKARRAYNRKAQ